MLNHDPSLEWPGPSSRTNSPPPLADDTRGQGQPASASWVTMRLLVTKTSILSKKQRIAIVDGYSEVQFGRDAAPVGSATPRIRLKEMEASKLHATGFWNAARKEWAVVDMGSKHGTFLRSSGSDSVLGESTGTTMRLSPTKMASVPRRIRHLDLLTIGSTTFQVHIHANRVPCVDCSPQGGDEIPLFSTASTRGEVPSLKRPLDTSGTEDNANHPKNPKKALSMLKHTLLTRHDGARQSTDSKTRYVDRSAARRGRQAVSHHDSPGVSLPRPNPEPSSASVSGPNHEDDKVVVSAPPTPIPATNPGHRLLMKQGWQPGTSLGMPATTGDHTGLLEPLELGFNRDRAGLGVPKDRLAPQAMSRTVNWMETARQKRWEHAQLHGDGDKR